MAIEIKIGGDKEKKVKNKVKASGNIRKSVDGNIMMLDHEDIDIIVMPEKMKVLILASETLDEKIYESQSALMRRLQKKGLIEPESIKSGNVYGSLQANILKSIDEKTNPVDLVVLCVSRWLAEEMPSDMYKKGVEEKEVDRLVDPDAEDTTPLGLVPHAKDKGVKQNAMANLRDLKPFQ